MRCSSSAARELSAFLKAMIENPPRSFEDELKLLREQGWEE
jgi:hypothetical protein